MDEPDPSEIEVEEPSSEKPGRKVVRNAIDLQRIKLEKLMKNPEKPIIIPETPKEKDFVYSVPTFVRNVMGSSAGAGSGEFHVYRNLRRKEYARQKMIGVKGHKESLDQKYRDKIEKNRLDAEAKTAKKRAKRLKKKEKQKMNKKLKKNTASIQNDTDMLSDESENSSDEHEKKGSESDTDKISKHNKKSEHSNAENETIILKNGNTNSIRINDEKEENSGEELEKQNKVDSNSKLKHKDTIGTEEENQTETCLSKEISFEKLSETKLAPEENTIQPGGMSEKTEKQSTKNCETQATKENETESAALAEEISS